MLGFDIFFSLSVSFPPPSTLFAPSLVMKSFYTEEQHRVKFSMLICLFLSVKYINQSKLKAKHSSPEFAQLSAPLPSVWPPYTLWCIFWKKQDSVFTEYLVVLTHLIFVPGRNTVVGGEHGVRFTVTPIHTSSKSWTFSMTFWMFIIVMTTEKNMKKIC